MWLHRAFEAKNLGIVTLPFVQGKRIWSIFADAIQYSDNYGSTWISWVDIDPALPVFSYRSMIFVDSAGNCYYNSSDESSGQKVGILVRVDAADKSSSVVIRYHVQGIPDVGATNIPYVLGWGITEDNAGNIYVGQYGIVSGTASPGLGNMTYPDPTTLGVAYVWKSPSGGLAFTRFDMFARVPDGPAYRHMHVVKCNPFNDHLYMTMGDAPGGGHSIEFDQYDSKRFYVSVDGLMNITRLGQQGGYTGMTFSKSAVLLGTDYNSNGIFVSIDDASEESYYELPDWLLGSQVFGLHHFSESEVWVSSAAPQGSPSTLYVLDQVRMVRTLVASSAGPDEVGEPVPPLVESDELPGVGFDLFADDGRGTLPSDCPFLFVRANDGNGNTTGIVRIGRDRTDTPLDDITVFNADFYLSQYADLQAAFGSNADAARNHWLRYGITEGRRGSREFDVQFYLGHYEDLRTAFGNNVEAGLKHWLRYGTREGRRGSREFDVQFYIGIYNDLQVAFGGNFKAAIDHWIRYGIWEGRHSSQELEVQFYLSYYSDLQAAFGNNYVAAIDHWINQGLPNEGRRGSLAFDVQFYLGSYSDLQAAFGNNYVAAIDHWINTGIAEGRIGAP
jgi:hypothetical protein